MNGGDDGLKQDWVNYRVKWCEGALDPVSHRPTSILRARAGSESNPFGRRQATGQQPLSPNPVVL